MWIEIEELLNQSKKFPTLEIIKYLKKDTLNLKLYADENHNLLKTEIE